MNITEEKIDHHGNSFCVVSGVEFAAELRDFVTEDLKKQYPGLTEHAQITLVHSRDHILNNYDEQVLVA